MWARQHFPARTINLSFMNKGFIQWRDYKFLLSLSLKPASQTCKTFVAYTCHLYSFIHVQLPSLKGLDVSIYLYSWKLLCLPDDFKVDSQKSKYKADKREVNSRLRAYRRQTIAFPLITSSTQYENFKLHTVNPTV